MGVEEEGGHGGKSRREEGAAARLNRTCMRERHEAGKQDLLSEGDCKKLKFCLLCCCYLLLFLAWSFKQANSPQN